MPHNRHRHQISEKRRQKMLALHKRAVTAPVNASRSVVVARARRAEGAEAISKQGEKMRHSRRQKQQNHSARSAQRSSQRPATASATRRTFQEADSSTWTMTPQTSSARHAPAPIPSYVVRNRKLAQICHERPPERLVRIRSDIGQFHRDATNGVDRYDAHTMHSNMSAGAYRRKKSGMSSGVYAHMTPMPQAPGNVGTFRLKSRGFDTFDENMAREYAS